MCVGFGKTITFLIYMCGILIVAGGTCEATARKYALLIGIDAYQGAGFTRLYGAHNDIRLVRGLLEQPRFGFASDNIAILLDDQATHAKILAAFDDLERKVQDNDFVYIHYSGHGSSVLDRNGDEKNGSGYDSTLVPYGARSSGATPPNGVTI
jgi:hypothetical protein